MVPKRALNLNRGCVLQKKKKKVRTQSADGFSSAFEFLVL